MNGSAASTDSATGETLVASGDVTSIPNHREKVGSYSMQTFNGSQAMNCHNSGSAAPLGTTVTSGAGDSVAPAESVAAVNSGPVLNGLATAIMPPSSNGVIQTPLVNSQTVVAAAAPGSQATGPTVTLVRPPMQTPGSGVTSNGNNSASPVVVASKPGQPVVGIQTPLVNNGPPSSSASACAGSHVIKAELPTTIIQSPTQPAVAPRTPVTVAAGPGGIRALAPQMLAPRLPQPSPGQPSVHNIQLPPGESNQTFFNRL